MSWRCSCQNLSQIHAIFAIARGRKGARTSGSKLQGKEREMRKFILAAIVAVSAAGSAIAADAVNPRLAADVTKAAGFEALTTQYVVANPTSIFTNHYMYGSKVTGQLQRGERVDALAKVRGYEWVLVGRNGEGIGYVPISMLAPADLYIP
jgi:hypothetical protein